MAEVKDRLREDLTAAIKAKDSHVMGTLRMAIAAIANEEVAGKEARELTAAEEQGVVTREARKRRESAQLYSEANRPELAEKETAEADVLARYLPAPLTEAELDQIIAEEIAAVGEPDVKKMGLVVRAVNAKTSGRADGSTVAAKVRAALTP